MMEEYFRDRLDRKKEERRERKRVGLHIKSEIGRERDGALLLGSEKELGGEKRGSFGLKRREEEGERGGSKFLKHRKKKGRPGMRRKKKKQF